MEIRAWDMTVKTDGCHGSPTHVKLEATEVVAIYSSNPLHVLRCSRAGSRHAMNACSGFPGHKSEGIDHMTANATQNPSAHEFAAPPIIALIDIGLVWGVGIGGGVAPTANIVVVFNCTVTITVMNGHVANSQLPNVTSFNALL